MCIPVPDPISTFITDDFRCSQSDLFERSNGRWMSLTPFLVVLLTEVAASQGCLSRSVRSLYRIGPKISFISHDRLTREQNMGFCVILPMLNFPLENESRDFLEKDTCCKYGMLR